MMSDLPPEATALLLLVAVALIAMGLVVLIARQLIKALESVVTRLTWVEASIRAGADRIHEVDNTLAQHTVVVREHAVLAPEAVQAQLTQLADENQRLANAVAVALQYEPDPAKGTYQNGAADAIAHVKSHVQAAL